MLTGEKTILEETVRNRVAFWAPLAEDQQRNTAVDIPRSATEVSVPAGDLEAAVDALLGNVFAHTPEGTAYSIRVSVTATHAEIVFSDAGPGLSSEMVTLRGSSTAGSTGLGLDIVRKTAAAARGELNIGASADGGARFTVVLPIT
ncbi:MAG: HAMP domain-containing histidine kinase [Acidimicrobiia bacterium]|nr:HAMP domain-containing histidine kinase [Acidimicrobiia bacterium]